MKKILIVDDDVFCRETLLAALNHFFVTLDIREAIDGEDGLNLARSFQPDIILSDYRMPKMNGIEMLDCMEREKVTFNKAFLVTSEANLVCKYPIIFKGFAELLDLAKTLATGG